jgi:hypothetical protein
VTDAMSRFIAAESARLRADGISEERIAWLLGTKPANANEPVQNWRKRLVPLSDERVKFRGVVLSLLAIGPMTVTDLVNETGRSRSRIRAWITGAVRGGHVRRTRVGGISAVSLP